MAGTGKNLVFASRAAGNGKEGGPTYIEGLYEGTPLPGAIAQLGQDGGGTPSFEDFDASGKDPLIVDINAAKQGNMDDAYASGDTVITLQPRAGQKFNCRTVASFTGVLNTPLTITGGQVKVAVATETIYAYLDEAVSGLAADSLVRVRWALGAGLTL